MAILEIASFEMHMHKLYMNEIFPYCMASSSFLIPFRGSVPVILPLEELGGCLIGVGGYQEIIRRAIDNDLVMENPHVRERIMSVYAERRTKQQKGYVEEVKRLFSERSPQVFYDQFDHEGHIPGISISVQLPRDLKIPSNRLDGLARKISSTTQGARVFLGYELEDRTRIQLYFDRKGEVHPDLGSENRALRSMADHELVLTDTSMLERVMKVYKEKVSEGDTAADGFIVTRALEAIDEFTFKKTFTILPRSIDTLTDTVSFYALGSVKSDDFKRVDEVLLGASGTGRLLIKERYQARSGDFVFYAPIYFSQARVQLYLVLTQAKKELVEGREKPSGTVKRLSSADNT